MSGNGGGGEDRGGGEDALEELAQALGRRQRTIDAEPSPWQTRAPQWESVARGEGDADAVAQARVAAGDDPADVDRAHALFDAISEADDDDLIAAARARIQAHERGRDERGSDTADASTKAANGPSWPRWLLLGAAAAAVLAWFVIREGDPATIDDPLLMAEASLPPFRVQTDPGLRRDRGAEAGVDSELHYDPRNHFTWVLTPDTQTQESLGVRVVAFGDDGQGRALDIPHVEISESGAVKLEGEVAELGLEPGRWRVLIVVARAARLPSAESLEWSVSDSDELRVMQLEITIET